MVSVECCRSLGFVVEYGLLCLKRRLIVGDLSSFCCLNPTCADLGKRGHDHLG